MHSRKDRSQSGSEDYAASPALARVVWAIALLGAVFALTFGRQLSGDVYWHLKTGEWIVANRAFPFDDPFSFTATKVWILQEWGFQVVAFLISRISLELLTWICVVVVFGTIALIYRVCRNHSSAASAFLVTALTAGVFADMLDVRPHVMGLLFFAIAVCWLDRERRSGRGVPHWMPVLFLIWANFHSSFTAGLILLAVETGASFLQALKEREPGAFRRFWRDAAVTLAAALAACVNPNGFMLYEFPLRTVSHGGMTSMIAEWLSPDFRSLSGAFTAFLILTALWGLARRDKPASTRDLLRVSVFLLAALSARRLGPFFAMAGAPIIASWLGPWFDGLLRSKRLAWTLGLITAVAVIGGVTYRISEMDGRTAFEHITTTEAFPDAACDFIEAYDPPGPMFNELNYGGYLIWRLWPEYRVFIDNRNDIFYDGAFEEFTDAVVVGGGSPWRRVFERYGIRLVVIEPMSMLADILSDEPAWECIYEDRKVVIFALRSAEPPRALRY